MKKLLLTGFGPFAENSVNPTEPLVKELNQATINNYKITSRILPVSYEKASLEISRLIEEENPDVIICLGLAADRDAITPELIAINYQHSETADNDGVIKKFAKIDDAAKESFITTLPIEEFIKAINDLSINAKLSSTAGTYVCNTVMYQALRKVAQLKLETRSGFIHVPATMDHEDLLKAITACINTL